VSPSQRRVRLSVALVAAAVVIALFVLRRMGVDEMLFRIFAASGALLVAVLYVTYRTLQKMVAAAQAAPSLSDDSGTDR
jgi:hypothetical protein